MVQSHNSHTLWKDTEHCTTQNNITTDDEGKKEDGRGKGKMTKLKDRNVSCSVKEKLPKDRRCGGRVLWFDTTKRYGFMRTDEGKDIFVHYTGLRSENTRRGLNQGDLTNIGVRAGRKGLEAVNIIVVNRPVTVENDARQV